MIVPAPIRQKHDLVLPYVDDASVRVQDLVRSFCDKQGFAYLGRKKGVESLTEKIETGRFDKWSDLDDLFACAIIIPTLSDEQEVIEFLRATFAESSCKLRGTTKKDPQVFRFDATRFSGRLKAASIPGASAGLLSVRFEIQVRTAFEHAWSVSTHALTYKSSQVDWRHARLASQLKAAVEQLDQLISSFEQSASVIANQEWPDVKGRQMIFEGFQEAISRGSIPTEVVPASWGRFCENLQQLLLSTTEKRIHDQTALVTEAMTFVNREIDASAGAKFPRSVSLLQFCLGALTKHGLIDKPLNRYTPLVTTELLDLYPQAKVVGTGFDFESSTT